MLLPDMEATDRLAGDVVTRSRPGDLLVLTGPLGAGKTTLTKAIARQLGSTAVVTSPTYTLVHEYPTPLGTLVHVDAYRLADAADVERLGLDEYLGRSRLTVVEWGRGLLSLYPEALWIEMSLGSGGASGDAVATATTRPDDDMALREARWRDPREVADEGPAAGSDGGRP